MNLAAYRNRSGYGKRKAWSVNAVNARKRKRFERAEAEPVPESAFLAPKFPKLKHATVTIECGSERVSFRVIRYDEKRLMMRGKAQASATIGKRIALVLAAVL
jgi:hypothetical protein